MAPAQTSSESLTVVSTPVFKQAEYGVPHCQFEKTTEGGFKVSFRKPTEIWILLRLVSAIAGMLAGMVIFGFVGNKVAGSLGSVVAGIIGIGVGIVFPVIFVMKGGKSSHIEVTGDTVIIDGIVLNRADFHHFRVGGTTSDLSPMLSQSQLGYSYGLRTFGFGGVWEARQVQEVAKALNDHLRKAPFAGQEQQPSPEHLRDAARPPAF